jgi:hypothetical protein
VSSSREPDVDVIVVGAGLAGLAAAWELQIRGLRALVLEASDGVGGRVRTDRIDGVLVDRGFQLLNPAYPEVRRTIDVAALALRPFTPGVVLAGVDRDHDRLVADPRRLQSAALRTLRDVPGTWAERVRFVSYAARLAVGDGTRVAAATPDTEVSALLNGFGDIGEQVLAPFLAGVLFDDSRTASRRFVDLLVRSFVLGTPSVPAAGMQALSDQLARGVDVHLDVAARSVTATSVRTDDGELHARAVVVATDPTTAADLVPGVEVPTLRSGTTWWHLADVPADDIHGGLPILVVDPQRRGPLVNSVVVSAAAPSYSPGRALVASTALGLDATEMDVRRHLALLHRVDTTRWELVAEQRLPLTVPAVMPGDPLRRPARVGEVYVAGDHRDTASIQGALVSGRRVATAVARALA